MPGRLARASRACRQAQRTAKDLEGSRRAMKRQVGTGVTSWSVLRERRAGLRPWRQPIPRNYILEVGRSQWGTADGPDRARRTNVGEPSRPLRDALPSPSLGGQHPHHRGPIRWPTGTRDHAYAGLFAWTSQARGGLWRRPPGRREYPQTPCSAGRRSTCCGLAARRRRARHTRAARKRPSPSAMERNRGGTLAEPPDRRRVGTAYGPIRV